MSVYTRAWPWWDVFTFTEDGCLECPDCEQRSPELQDIWQAVEWVERHCLIDCEANR